MKKVLGYGLVLSLCCILFINPEQSVYYASKGLALCGDIIVPSLFPFFVCSGLLVYSGFCEVLAKLFSPVMKPLFNINPSGAAAFVLGLISGYPQGAVTAGQLYDGMYLSKSEAERLLAFCNNSGPLFILGTVGVSVYHSVNAGIMLYAAHILGAISVGIVFRFYKSDTYNAPVNSINTKKQNVSEIFSQAITDSITNILKVCAAVLFCSVISNLIMDMLMINDYCKAVIASMLEFVSGIGRISYLDAGMSEKLLLSAAVCAFAGISVHLQVMGVVAKSKLSLKPYIIGKFLHSAFAVLYTFIFLKLFPVTENVFSTVTGNRALSLGFFMSSVFVILLTITLIIIFTIFIFSDIKKGLRKQTDTE